MSDRRENLIEVKRYAIIVNVPLERPIPLNFEQSMEGLKKFSIWRREATCFTEKEKKQFEDLEALLEKAIYYEGKFEKADNYCIQKVFRIILSFSSIEKMLEFGKWIEEKAKWQKSGK